jgi:hypothetical protein
MLAGIWLGVKASWWTQWPADRRRAALALGSTAPFTPRRTGSHDRALADAAHAPLWAWQELSLLLRQALPALELRLQAEWRIADDSEAPEAAAPCARPPTQAELSRARRQWLAAVRGV